MNNSVYAPHSMVNIFSCTLKALKDRLSESGRWFLLILLCCFLGIFGIHRFAAKKWGGGILFLLTLGFLGIGVVIDLISLLREKFVDGKGNVVSSGLKGTQRFTLFCLVFLGVQWLSLYYSSIPFLLEGIELIQSLFEMLMVKLSHWETGIQAQIVDFIQSILLKLESLQ